MVFVYFLMLGMILGLLGLLVIKKIDGCYLIKKINEEGKYIPITVVKNKEDVNEFFGWKSCNRDPKEISEINDYRNFPYNQNYF